jgi:hypothetical protein
MGGNKNLYGSLAGAEESRGSFKADVLASAWQLYSRELLFIVLLKGCIQLGYNIRALESERFDICRRDG